MPPGRQGKAKRPTDLFHFTNLRVWATPFPRDTKAAIAIAVSSDAHAAELCRSGASLLIDPGLVLTWLEGESTACGASIFIGIFF